MKKKLTSNGNGWDLYFRKPLLQLLGSNPPETKVLFTVKRKLLLIEAVDPQKEEAYKGLMVRNFSKSGGGWGLYIPNPILELLDINPETDLVEYEVDERILKIKKAE